MIKNVVIFGDKLYNQDSYVSFGFYNAFFEIGGDYNIEWIDEKNLDVLSKMTTNTMFIINKLDFNDRIALHCSNYYVLLKCDPKRFRTMDKNRVSIIEYNSTMDFSKYTKIDDYIYERRRKRTIVMPYGSMLTPRQIIDNLENFIELKDRKNRTVLTRSYNNNIFGEVIKTQSKDIYIKRLISLDDEVDLIRSINLSCCFASNVNKIDYKTLTHISYGTMCITNSEITHKLLKEKTFYLSDARTYHNEKDDYLNSIKKNELFDLIELIANNHTFLNRIRTIFKYFGI